MSADVSISQNFSLISFFFDYQLFLPLQSKNLNDNFITGTTMFRENFSIVSKIKFAKKDGEETK